MAIYSNESSANITKWSHGEGRQGVQSHENIWRIQGLLGVGERGGMAQWQIPPPQWQYTLSVNRNFSLLQSDAH